MLATLHRYILGMSVYIVAEYPSLATLFPFNVATYRINEATYLCIVAMFLFSATLQRSIVAT
jgi:hypothetical protein